MSMTRWLVPMIVIGTLALGACGEGAVAPVNTEALAPTPLGIIGGTPTYSLCTAGWFDPNGGNNCVEAAPGYYVPADGYLAQLACPSGTYTGTKRSTSCTPASPGHYAPGKANTNQTPCAKGTYQPSAGQANCFGAAAGYYAFGLANVTQTACDYGTYQPNRLSESCLEASIGHFVSDTAATSQTACSPGTFAANTRSTSCADASPGSYVPFAGMGAVTPCALGSYQPAAGQASCLLADIGFYVDVTNATAQTACPAGTTTFTTGATSVAQCVRPFAWQGFESPLDPAAVNVAKAGSAVAVKFSLGADEGLAIFQAGFPSSATVACTGGATTSAETETETAGQSTLTYDAASDQYKYIWKTEKGWNGTCRRLTIKFTDTSVRTIDFQFTK